MASKKHDFGVRLKEAFNRATNASIAEMLGVAEVTVGFYVRERIPDAETLVKISNITNRSVDWLLTGKAPLPEKRESLDPLINREALSQIIREIVREEMSFKGEPNAGEVGPFKPLGDDIMLAPSIGFVDGGEGSAEKAEEAAQKRKKTG